jgi:hypothetical protein
VAFAPNFRNIGPKRMKIARGSRRLRTRKACNLRCFVHSSKGNFRYHSRALADVRWSAGQSSRGGRQTDHAGRFALLALPKLAASLFSGGACYEVSRISRCWRGFPESSRCIGPAHIDRGKLAKIARAAALQSLIPLASLNAINGSLRGRQVANCGFSISEIKPYAERKATIFQYLFMLPAKQTI